MLKTFDVNRYTVHTVHCSVIVIDKNNNKLLLFIGIYYLLGL